MKDIILQGYVRIHIREDGKVIWVNVDEECILRFCCLGNLVIHDERQDGNDFKPGVDSSADIRNEHLKVLDAAKIGRRLAGYK